WKCIRSNNCYHSFIARHFNEGRSGAKMIAVPATDECHSLSFCKMDRLFHPSRVYDLAKTVISRDNTDTRAQRFNGNLRLRLDKAFPYPRNIHEQSLNAM